jgi:hypothetical protein
METKTLVGCIRLCRFKDLTKIAPSQTHIPIQKSEIDCDKKFESSGVFKRINLMKVLNVLCCIITFYLRHKLNMASQALMCDKKAFPRP